MAGPGRSTARVEVETAERRLVRRLQELAWSGHVTYVDAGRGLTGAVYNPDGIHPNDAGYRIIARNIGRSLRL